MPRVRFGAFSIDAPSNWTLSSVVLAGPVDAAPSGEGQPRGFQRNVVTMLEQVADGTTPQAYVAKQLKGLKDAGVQRKEGRPPETLDLGGGLEGLLTEQVITGADGQPVRQMQLTCIKRNIAHVVIATHMDGPMFEAAREEFHSLLSSFR